VIKYNQKYKKRMKKVQKLLNNRIKLARIDFYDIKAVEVL